jgi:hypothetical protein
MSSSNDVIVWADGTWCFGYELQQMSHMSDDYEVVPCDSARYNQITAQS